MTIQKFEENYSKSISIINQISKFITYLKSSNKTTAEPNTTKPDNQQT
ncbi:MAG: hypothetical protein M1480_00485 [Bacteroidetes bacterium]|nr:hypothetical protein [Bacteroidota bacterium]